MNTVCKLEVQAEDWPIAGSFVISRGARTIAKVIKVSISSDTAVGVGECVPYARYGETIESVTRQLASISDIIESGLTRTDLQDILPAGAARNALDCALWDLEAKQTGVPAWKTAGLSEIGKATTAFTISLGEPEKMASDCVSAKDRTLLKVKLGGDGDVERMRAIRAAAPDARLILDANESWDYQNLVEHMRIAHEIGADLIEQPLPAANDQILADIDRLVPVCADESLHTRNELALLKSRYDCINIKLDKTGGLTEALKLKKDAIDQCFSIMVGCMVSTSLSMAPAMLVAQNVDFVDLDGPLLLAKDRDHAIEYSGSTMHPPSQLLWG